MSESPAVAVVGAASEAGAALLERLAESRLSALGLHALGTDSERGMRLKCGRREVRVECAADFDFSSTLIALFCPHDDASAELAHRARAEGAVVVDSAGLLRNEPDVPLVLPSVNPDALAGAATAQAVALPDGPATQLVEVLAPLERAVGVVRAEVFHCLPAAARGSGGIEELAGQTARLLSGKPADASVFPRQIAFNLIPEPGMPELSGRAGSEHAMIEQVGRLLGGGLAVNVTSVLVPVFHADSQAVHLELREPLPLPEVRSLWEAAGIEVAGPAEERSDPTPVERAAGRGCAAVGRLRQSAPGPRGLSFWIVADSAQCAGTRNSLEVAEILVKNYL